MHSLTSLYLGAKYKYLEVSSLTALFKLEHKEKGKVLGLKRAKTQNVGICDSLLPSGK